MRKIIILALVAIPIIVVLTFPVSVALPWLGAPDALGQVHGNVWSGSARWSQPGHAPMNLTWRWGGARHWNWRAGDGTTELTGRLQAGNDMILQDLSGRLELGRVDIAYWLMGSRPTGYLELDIPSARLVAGEVPQLTGQVIWEEARLEGAIHESLGRILIELEPGATHQLARVSSMSPGAVEVQGQIEADAERYHADILLRADPNRPDVDRQLDSLGERQPDGQVRLRLSGALGW